MTEVGKLYIKYEEMKETRTYPIVVGALTDKYYVKFKGVDWGGERERLIYIPDAADNDLTPEYLEFEIFKLGYKGAVGIYVVDALGDQCAYPLVTRSEVPDVGNPSEYLVSTSTTPGWTLRVKVKRV